MPNMSYCRFENTLNDMRDCLEAAWDIEVVDGKFVDGDGEELNEYETRAIQSMVDVAQSLHCRLDDIMENG